MGSRDYRRRESKKIRKETKKPTFSILTPQTEVEIIKKGKKGKQESPEND